ncbi:microtubule-associated protein Jupiter isoform X5 [Drosophila mojavensis]|uniref:Microtubule-associated protein Jupiter n=1 Tax=Drosophila mojavensis TaxID=7230 RepID=A0A0Q9WXH7_DROMO|nr:microtubule-associated protein Jupiter isoform X5 [Drosophila mojavensis]KRG00557.1 uncharacterized protein Dmoj_GI23754, isoform C [Drosophila mojavensis]
MIANFEISDNKSDTKVLRAPGGVSSDIFGSEQPQTPRNVKNLMASNIFSADTDAAQKNNGETPRRGQKPVDSYSRLFGEPARPITPSKNHMKSNIPFGQNPNTAPLISKGNYNGKSGSVSSASSSVSSSTENLKINGGVRSEGNPVTGEGYKAGGTDYIQPAHLNGGSQVINKNRVPPGGYSSGLW